MSYERLSDEELEQWLHASPDDTAAMSEVLRRFPRIVNEQSKELIETQEQAEKAEQRIKDTEAECDRLREDVETLETQLLEAREKLKRVDEFADLWKGL